MHKNFPQDITQVENILKCFIFVHYECIRSYIMNASEKIQRILQNLPDYTTSHQEIFVSNFHVEIFS